MSNLCLSFFNGKKLELMEGHVSSDILYSHVLRSIDLVMLKSNEANLYQTECMLRGLPLKLTTVEPGKKVSMDYCHILHFSNEYPDFDDDGYLWIRRT